MGSTGPQGPQGLTGPQGQIGPQGAQGTQGSAGVTGPTGAPGAPGSGAGPQGSPGVTGPQGATGVTGQRGATGTQGVTGVTGPQGPTGQAGPTGPTGPAGSQGSPGVTGLQGPTGVGLPIGTGVTGNHLAVGTAGRLAFANDVVVGSDGRSIAFGANGATAAANTGLLRTPYNSTIVESRGSSGTFEVPVLRYGVGGVTDAIIIGGGSEGVAGIQLETTTGSTKIKSATVLEYDFAPSVADWQFNDLTNLGNVGIPSGYLRMGPSSTNDQVVIVNPGNIAAAVAALPASGGTLLLRPGVYGTVDITSTTGSRITIAALGYGSTQAFGGPQVDIRIGWAATGTPHLTLAGLNLNKSSGVAGSSNAVAQFSTTPSGAVCVVRDCNVIGRIDLRVGVSLVLDNTDAETAWAAALELRNGSKIRDTIMSGTATSVRLTEFLSAAGAVQTSVGTLAMDQYSFDSFAASRSKMSGSGPLRTVAGIQAGAILPDANAAIGIPTGGIWLVPGTNSADRTYTVVPGSAQDQVTFMIENRDSSSNAKIISTTTGTPSGTIATLAANMGHVFKYTLNVGVALQSRYPLAS